MSKSMLDCVKGDLAASEEELIHDNQLKYWNMTIEISELISRL